MWISYDPAKNALNLTKDGVDVAAASALERDTSLQWLDTCREYAEERECGIGYIGLTLYFVAPVDRDRTRRIISLRKANRKEVARYGNA